MHITLPRILYSGAALALLMFPVEGYSQLYIGGGGGQSKFQDIDQVQSACNTVGATCGVDDSDTGYKVFIGYRMARYLAFEAGYIDLGEATASSVVPVSATASLTAEGGYVALLPQLPLGPSVSIFGRIGLSGVDAKLKAAGGGLTYSDSSGAAGLVLGGGAEIHLTDNISIRGEWERHSFDEALDIAGVKIDAPDVDLLSASVILRF